MNATLTEVEIWNRAIQPETGDLAEATARELLRLHLVEDDQQRVRHLSTKANAGTLSISEEQELDSYLNVGRAIEFLKAKARLSLRQAGA